MSIYRQPALLGCSLLFALAGVQAATITATTLQTINGIGASGAWWTLDLARFPMEVRQNVSELLLNQTFGMGLTDYRYNLGGGGVGVNSANRAPETPYIKDGVYNFSADAAGAFYLREAARHGVPQITLFVNSAPTTFVDNGKSCGGTIITDRIPAFAQYIADVVSYWKSEGVKITHVSPMNEPDNSFSGCAQEGMQVPIFQRGNLLRAVASALSNQGLDAKVIGDETSWAPQFAAEAPFWLNHDVGSAIGAVVHHQYAFVDGAAQGLMVKEARSLSGNSEVWATEICCYKPILDIFKNNPESIVVFGAQYDPTMVGGLRMGKLIFQSLSDAQENHWDWWTALSNQYGSCSPSTDPGCVEGVQDSSGYNDGLIYYDPNYQTTGFYGVHLTKRYYILKHFTKAAPIGAVVRQVSDTESGWRVMAFDYPQPGQLYSVVAMNMNSDTNNLALGGASGFSLSAAKESYRTSANEDYAPIDAPAFGSDGTMSISAPGFSVYTLFF